ncbi:hypothetical protein NA8A_04300 [Nitratireductor indicus C115]|uniref:Uncharacterized protein n=1 Tax=Nitratireductor indicus C115 TaxID=1231190 RepID=K2PSF3_9HYPH|nr:hypothetical protein [Nitratireductor indicus]EKF44002.1 hypothetical protein NA8A_04300 [Nitratireductor indicus C115]SFQ12408.1 hypothetical protein SAMN05216176_101455 [Nitratireductor indicus]
MIRWKKSSYRHGRHTAFSGCVEVGAVFPPIGAEKWRWRMFVGDNLSGPSGTAKDEHAAKAALDLAWTNFLLRARLKEMPE